MRKAIAARRGGQNDTMARKPGTERGNVSAEVLSHHRARKRNPRLVSTEGD